jgi:biopolymer transport protein ExbD
MNGYATELNVTPLIDVLLVLVVMLILGIPIATHIVQLDLPTQRKAPAAPPPAVDIDIDYDGRVFWDGTNAQSERQLEQWLVQAGERNPQPIIRVWPDKRAPYERVAQVLAAAQRARVKDLALAPIAD